MATAEALAGIAVAIVAILVGLGLVLFRASNPNMDTSKQVSRDK